jgi:phosphoglycolate phosphatase-like HAD superfamily hydrolase
MSLTARATKLLLVCITVALLACGCRSTQAATDPLASWKDGPTKQAILDFVRATTEDRSPKFVPPSERIATFDNDGTLWVEQPIYTEVQFAIDRIVAMAPQHPEWRNKEPYKSVLAQDREAIRGFTAQDTAKLVAMTHSGMTEEAFLSEVKEWLAIAKHPRFKRPYTELVYQPMLELMGYLRANGYKTYIVTGGGQEFVRAFAEHVYGVVPEQVIGSAGKVKYEYDATGRPILVKLPEMLFIDDKTGKPEGINLMIGRRPYAAAGNSIGDQQMLEYTQAGQAPRFMMLVHHDDPIREYEYGPNSKVGTFSDALAAEAKERGWMVVSMKNDWKRVFSFEQ